MSGKDPFQILADEITLIRGEIERLQRTSLNRDEAKALHKIVTEKADDMLEMGPLVERAVESKLNVFLAMLGTDAVRAAEDAVIQSHAESVKAAKMLLRDAQEARRGAWRTFGSFGAWIALTAALCLSVGALATMAIQGRADAVAFGEYTGLYCASVNGRKFTANDGKEYCGVPIDD